MDDEVLRGKRALILGAETPAGAAVARALIGAGVELGLAAMRADEGVLAARRLQREAEAAGLHAATYAFDVMLGQNVKVSTRQVAKELGGLDILVSACDRPFEAAIGRTTDSDLAQTMTGNCYAHFFAIRAALDEFRHAEGGRILVVANEAGEAGLPGASAYAAAHAATLSLVRSLTSELHDAGVGIDVVTVGAVEGHEAALGNLALTLLASPRDASGRIERLGPVEAARGQ
jgi:NAD(P)-dependent dehydrogenase (short-subunit alcohol dehydrogenase family)